MSGRTQVVDVTYDDHRTGGRVWERKVQPVPYHEIEEIRGQELALFRPPEARARADRRDERDYYGGRAYDDDHYVARPRPRDRLAPPIDDRHEERYVRRSVDGRRDRRRDDYRERRRRDDDSDSDSESSRERRRRRRHRRAKSEHASNRGAQEEEDDGGRLWWSNKPRKEGKWHERNFDSSYDGLIAAAAGGAIGGLTAKYFGGEENKRWKIAGGALAGAAGFNLAENKYRLYTEEKENDREKQGKPRRDGDDEGMAGPFELGGHLLAGTAP